MFTESIEYDVAGTRYVGYLARPDGASSAARRPGILVCHEGNGLGPQVKERAHQLAELGYVAFCVDYIGGGIVIPDLPTMMTRLGALRADLDHVRALGRAGLAQLVGRAEVDASRLAAIGYCFGGQFALELARDGAPLAATVAFHAALSARNADDAKRITGKVLACIGADDPLVPPDQRAAFEVEMRGAGIDWRLYVYGGVVHGFSNPLADQLGHPAVRYHPATHRRSWAEMRALFDEVFATQST